MEALRTSTITPTVMPASHKQGKTDAKAKDKVLKMQPPVNFQPKLPIGAPDDIYEKEADAMADKVMRMSIPEPVSFSTAKNRISRKCDECEEEEKIQMKSESRSRIGMEAPSVVHDVVNSSGGKSLDESTRSFMESRFGKDFRHVKIHSDAQASKAAAAVNSKAFTVGSEIVFGHGHYSPGSISFNKLLAHELTHVVQNSSREVRRVALNVVNDIGSEKTIAVNAANSAEEMVNKAQIYMGGTFLSRYKTWYDKNYDPKIEADVTRFNKVKHGWVKIHSVFKSKKIELDCSARNQSWYAQVNTGDGKYRIKLGKDFWATGKTGRDSQGGSIVHEISHEELYTDDHEYGTTKGLKLAQNSPDKAIDNADNWEYFGEDSI